MDVLGSELALPIFPFVTSAITREPKYMMPTILIATNAHPAIKSTWQTTHEPTAIKRDKNQGTTGEPFF